MEQLIKKYARGELTLVELANLLGEELIRLGEMNGAAAVMYIAIQLDDSLIEKYQNELLEIASYVGEEI